MSGKRGNVFVKKNERLPISCADEAILSVLKLYKLQAAKWDETRSHTNSTGEMPPQGIEPSTIFLQRQSQDTKDSCSVNCARILLVCLRILHRHSNVTNTLVTWITNFNPRLRCRTTEGQLRGYLVLTFLYAYTKRAFFGVLHTSMPVRFISSDKNLVAANLITVTTYTIKIYFSCILPTQRKTL